MNHQFSEYVSSSVFNLNLSKNMINALMAIYANDRLIASGNSRFVTACGSLKGRGLVVHIEDITDINRLSRNEGYLYSGDWMMSQPFNRIFILTKAGELVCDLLVEAGLFDPGIKKAEPFKNPTRSRFRKRAKSRRMA